MSWFFIALAAPLLWAIVNHTDKYLLSKYFKGHSIGALIIFSTLIALIVLPFAYFFDQHIFEISFRNGFILVIAGILGALAVLSYLYALDDEDVSIVVPLFQLIPIFGFILGYFLLGETLTAKQISGCVLIIFGSVFISIERGAKMSIKWKLLGLMVLASLLFATYDVTYKVAAVEEGFWVSIFWEHVGLFVIGLFFFIAIRTYRRQFLAMIGRNSGAILGINLGSEIINIVANLLTNFALLLAPVALVLTVSGLQPLFVFILSVVITIFLPKLGQEKITRIDLIQKIVAIIIILSGSVFLY